MNTGIHKDRCCRSTTLVKGSIQTFGNCREYYPDAKVWRGGHTYKRSSSHLHKRTKQMFPVRVRSSQVLPHWSIVIAIETVGMASKCYLCLLEPDNSEIVQVDKSLVTLQSDGQSKTVLTNATGCTQTLPADR